MRPQSSFEPAVYKDTYVLVRKFITDRAGSQEDVEDILQEGFYTFFKKMKEEKVDLYCDIPFFVLGICKNLWRRELCRRQGPGFTETIEALAEDAEDEIQHKKCKELMFDLLLKNLRKVSERCQHVFALRMEGLSCEEIAEEMGLETEQVARNKTFTCKKRLIELVKNDPEYILHLRQN